MEDLEPNTRADVTVKRAERENLPTLLRLIEALADFEKLAPPDSGARQRLEQHGWPENGQKPLFTAWLAYRHDAQTGDATPAAYAITFLTYSSFLCRPTFYIEDIFVLPDFRRHGIGTFFMEHLKREAETQQCGRMEWVVLDWNTDAQVFYQKFGAQHLSEWQCYRLRLD